jgi:hypothetical protein
VVRTGLAAIALAALLPLAAGAQELPKAKKFTDVTWYGVLSLNFKVSKFEEGSKIIHEHFAPAGDAAGMEGIRVIQALGGEWDMLILFPLQDGPAALEWEVSPDDEKFWAALAQREGGAEKAFAVLGQYLDTLERADYQIAFERRPAAGQTAARTAPK